MTSRLLGRLVMIALLLVSAPAVAFAQEAVLSGTVTDATGGVLPGVTITAVHQATGNKFTAITDVRGVYRIAARAGELVLIPDSLNPGNQSGFYWDYSPPKGTDTIRVFSSTDLQTAQLIRDRVASLQGASGNASATLKTRAIASGMQSLRQQLTAVAARGILTVPDTGAHVPGASSPVLPDAGQPPIGLPGVENPISPTPDAVPAASVATIPESAAAPPTPPADWAATSITIAISE